MKVFFLLMILSVSAHAKTLYLKEFNMEIPDIAERGLTKEHLYEDQKMWLVRTKDSICSNRAHVWAYNFLKTFDLNTPKMFLFYTPKTGDVGPVTWWYHVTPLVNENGKLWAMDAGYPHRIHGPMPHLDWLKEWNGKKSVCKEILPGEDDLVELMFKGRAFPEDTKYGHYNCYYKIVPPGYWTPRHLAQHLLGKDQFGKPVQFDRDEFNENEVVQACLETATTPIGWFFETKLGACRYFVSRGQ